MTSSDFVADIAIVNALLPSKHVMFGHLTNPRYRFLLLLIVADFVFVLLYGLYGFKILTDPKLGLIEDWSYAEVFQYMKELWIVVLLPFVAAKQRTWRYLVWMGVFTYLLLDDSCQFHELGGEYLVGLLDLPALGNLRPQDTGEMVFAGMVGGALLTAIFFSFWKASAVYRQTAMRLVALLFILAFFGLVVDMIHVEGYWLIDKALGAFEDGGESIVMSVITWFVYEVSLPDPE